MHSDLPAGNEKRKLSNVEILVMQIITFLFELFKVLVISVRCKISQASPTRAR